MALGTNRHIHGKPNQFVPPEQKKSNLTYPADSIRRGAKRTCNSSGSWAHAMSAPLPPVPMNTPRLSATATRHQHSKSSIAGRPVLRYALPQIMGMLFQTQQGL